MAARRRRRGRDPEPADRHRRGLLRLADAFYNPAEYFVWIFFWAVTVILSGLVGNLWYLLNPWAAIYDAIAARPAGSAACGSCPTSASGPPRRSTSPSRASS